MEKVKAVARKCEKHKRDCETFCFQCKGKEEPLCPICLCEHNAALHAIKNAHITTLITKCLDDIKTALDQTSVMEQKIGEHKGKAEAIRKEKDAVLIQVGEKLGALEAYCKTQHAQAEEFDKTLVDCLKNILVEMQQWKTKLEERVKVPARLNPKVNELLEAQKYWDAYDEATAALTNEVLLDEQEVAQVFEKCGKIGDELKKQFTKLDAVDVAGPGPMEMKKKCDELAQENAKMIGKSCLFTAIQTSWRN